MTPKTTRLTWKRWMTAAAFGLPAVMLASELVAQSPKPRAAAPAPLIVQVQAQARPLNTQRPTQQAAAQPNYAPVAGKSDVQLALEKLYEKNGRAMPEMVDARASQPVLNEQTKVPAYVPAQEGYQSGASGAAVAQQPQAMPAQPQAIQQQYAPPAQPSQAPVAAKAASAPKKRGLLNKWFGKNTEEEAPTQPPVEPVYTPPASPSAPSAFQPVTPPVVAQPAPMPQLAPAQLAPIQEVPVAAVPAAQPAPTGRPNYSQIFQDPQVPAQPMPALAAPAAPAFNAQQSIAESLSAPAVPSAQPPSAASDGLEAPLFVEAPDQSAQAPAAGGPLPTVDFNEPLVESSDTVELGEPGDLPGVSDSAAPVAAAPAAPADPFSDEALFPSSTPVESSPPAEGQESLVDQSLESTETLAEMPVNEAPAEAGGSIEAAPLAEAPAAETPVEPVNENPYSGLSLNSDPYAAPMARQAAPLAARQLPLEPASPPQMAATESEFAPRSSGRPYEVSTSPDEPPLTVDSGRDDASSFRSVPSYAEDRTRSKQELIAARQGLKGLKGFCPVALRDHRDLIDAQSEFRVVYNNKTYYLGSNAAVDLFLGDPAKYAPASRGCDVIQLQVTGEEVEGSLDHAVWYKGRLYMFTSAETMDTFVASPSSHATLD